MECIPQINGRCSEGTGAFVMPEYYGMEEIYPDIQEVFVSRMEKLGSFRMEKGALKAICFIQKDMQEEAYELKITEKNVRISAAGEKGYRHALTTLFQMLVQGRGTVPACELQDWPRFAQRGVMLDVCRHFFSIEEVKKIIEQISLLKMNHFHWHLSDDQGYRIESEKYPGLNEKGAYRPLSPEDPLVLRGEAKAGENYGGYYTKEQIRDVVRFAAARGVEVIPEIDLPGHSSAILSAFPQYTCSGEPLKVKNTFGVHERIFCAGNERAYQFLYGLLDEIFELFPSRYIHLGGDEAPKTVWHDCPACNYVMDEEKLENYEQLQTWFTARLIAYAKKHGKTAIVWNESAAAGDLDENAVIQYWKEMAPGDSYVVPEFEKGRKFILSSMNRFYCSDSYAESPMRATLMYEPETKGVAVPPENVLGIEAPMWTEWTPCNKDIEKQMYPRMLAVAECGWTRQRNVQDFLKRAENYLSYQELNLLEPMSWEEATIHGQKALEMIAGGMLELGAKYGAMTSGEPEEEKGKAEAVVPEGTQMLDMSTMIRMYMEDKMKAAYTEEEIDQVVEMILSAL